MICSIHFGWPTASIPKLLSEEYPFNLTREEVSYITIMGPIGSAAGNILTISLLDLIGRKNMILLVAIPQIICFDLIALSRFTPIVLYLARFIGGIAEGVCYMVLPIYTAEVAEPSIRGRLCSYSSIAFLGGVIIANVVGTRLTLLQAAVVYSTLPPIFLALFWKMPESPYYTTMKKDKEGTDASLRYLRGKEDVEEELLSITADVRRQLSESGTYLDIFRIDSNRKACLLILTLRIIHQFSGITAFMLYAQVLLKDATDAVSPKTASILLNLIQLLCAFILYFLVDKLGRKFLLICSTSGVSSILLIMGTYFLLKEHTTVDLSRFTFLPVVGMILYTIFFSFGLGGVSFTMIGELLSVSIKSKALGLMNILHGVLLAIFTKYYQYTADNWGLAVPFYTYGVAVGLGVVFCVFCVPETNGKTLEEIQQKLKGNRKVNEIELSEIQKCEVNV